MARLWCKTIIFATVLSSCTPFGESREVDWKKEWKEHANELKNLTREIKENRQVKYQMGNNEFPSNFSYPFDEGFYIGYGSRDSLIDSNNISIRYYINRGLLDHFSAFIYTKDSTEINQLERKIQERTNDFKIEDNWYIIND